MPQLPPENEGPRERGPRLIKNSRAEIPPGEFLVYYVKGSENVRCDPEGNELDGRNEAGRLFDRLEDARSYASKHAQTSGGTGAGVYDHRWRILAQFASEEFLRRETKRRQPSRLLLWSAVLLFIGAVLLWWEIRSGWTAIIGFLVGSRFLFSGAIKLTQALHTILERRRISVQSRSRRDAQK